MSSKPTREEAQAAREEKLAALHRRLADQVRELQSGQDWQRWLAVAAKFHAYSFSNTLAILMARPTATRVAGYKAWQQLGRQVDKGEKGIPILAPVLRRTPHGARGGDFDESAADADDGAAAQPSQVPGEPSRPRLSGFRIAYVWDIAQTSGDPLPEPPAPQLLTGAAPDGLWDALTALISERGFTVSRTDCGGANGTTDFLDRTVRVRPGIDDAQAVKTLIHEAAHTLLHDPRSGGEAPRAFVCRGVAEVEAESVAWLVATSHGLDASGYTFPYVASWATDVPGKAPDQVVSDTAGHVLSAARDILAVTQGPASAMPEQAAELAATTTAGEQRVGVALVHAEATRDQAQAGALRATLLAVHTDAQDWFDQQLPGSWVPRYLTERGLAGALDHDSPFRVGYAASAWTGLTSHLRTLGYSDSTIETAGLAIRARTGRLVDRFRERLVLPVRDPEGRIIGFIGRAAPTAGPATPRYLNSPETPLYRKREALFGLAEGRLAWQSHAVPVLVEGPLDAMAVTLAGGGRYAGLAPCGTARTQEQADHMTVAAPASGRLVVAYDGDRAGHAAVERAHTRVGPATPLDVRATRLHPGHDPASVLRTGGPEVLLAALDQAAPLIDLVVDLCLDQHEGHLQWSEGRIAAARDAAGILADLPPAEAVRQARRVAQRTGLPLQVVTDTVLDLAATPQPSTQRDTPCRAGSRARQLSSVAALGVGQTQPRSHAVSETLRRR